LSFIHI